MAWQADPAQRRSHPDRNDRLEDEGDPRYQPDPEQAPEQQQRHGVVISRNPAVEIAEHLLIHEIKPEEPAHLPLRGIGDTRRDMPRQCNGQKHQDAGNRVPAPQVAQVAIEQQKNKDDAQGEDDSYEPFCKHIEGASSGKAPGSPPRRLWLLEGYPEQHHGDSEPKANDHVGNNDVGVNKNAKKGEQDKRGIEAGRIRSEQAAAEAVHHQKQGERSNRQRYASGPILRPEDGEAGGHAPVHERSFFEVADAVGVEGNPIVLRDHFSRNFGMHRVSIIQQRWTKKRKACVEQQPKTTEREDYFPRTAGAICSDGAAPRRESMFYCETTLRLGIS